jgi:hypothetical protein
MRWLFVLSLVGCAAPLPIERRDYMVGQVADRYREFYPQEGDPDPKRDSGLLAPRFGLPAIAQAGGAFELVLLERGRPPSANVQLCKEGNCWPVELADRQSLAVRDGIEEVRYQARSTAPAGSYDLVLRSAVDAPVTAPRAVWLRAHDPAAPRAIRVVTLNDLHIGKGVHHLEDNLRRVVYDINQLQPDLVLVTGDLVNMGTEASQPPRAQKLLRGINAPLVAIVGNHDLGFDSFSRAEYGPGWSNFAKSFHPSLEMGFVIG